LVGMILGIPIFMIIKIILEETIAYIKKEKATTDFLDGE
jgi:predicted PurR-regulated permease PerM